MSYSSSGSQDDLPEPAPAFKIYRNYKDKCEEDWDGEIYPIQFPVHAHDFDDQPPPPFIVLVQGPPNVGKSLLIKSLFKYITGMEPKDDTRGPINFITDGYCRRLQFVECPDDINAMIDVAKYADLVLLMVDASYGFEAETFEFLNLLQVHGVSNVMGVLTRLDKFEDEKEMKGIIDRLQDHFRTEICQQATVSYLSGLEHDLYKVCEVQKLANDIVMLQFNSSSWPWRAGSPYMLVDRFEDVTPPEELHKDANCNRNLSLYGYLRGCCLKGGAKVHIAGVGDFHLAGVRCITDPAPSSSELEKQNDLVELNHMEHESFRAGTYLRLDVHSVPFKMVENLDPCRPILVGGINPEEENVCDMQARLKRHKWHMKLLKSADTVTVSAGWRRYQTTPIYATEVHHGRHEFLDFNEEHEHCLAMFSGPVAPTGTRIAVVQSNKDLFRIAAKAVILDPKHQQQQQPSLDPNHHSKIMKDSKQKGKPQKILYGRTILHRILKRRTAPTKFESENSDVAEFKGSPIWTRSGILGKVKKRKRIATAPVNEDLLGKEDPAPRQRRRVEISDEAPSSYPCSSYFMLLGNSMDEDKAKETVVIMSEEKRAELVKKQQTEKYERAEEKFFGGVYVLTC
ncbi:ribosome biogenesis protein BMS1 homolog [Papaver somniferum]|uniref:ribosome biogenesis protein BMS1 homolog n=1 Tax=Papaver somniferum TaxID=3469 RepID=UPI000E6FCD98|nr:ribosome biogenesis protein BMS1 homolog [Papaver somniferum]